MNTRFIKELHRVQGLVQQELTFIDCGESKYDPTQINLIRNELAKMEEALDPKVFLPVYPRLIVDSWDFSSPLGLDLLYLAQLYRNL